MEVFEALKIACSGGIK